MSFYSCHIDDDNLCEMKLLTLNTKSEVIKARSWWLISFSIIFNKLLLISKFHCCCCCCFTHESIIHIVHTPHFYAVYSLFLQNFIRNETNSKITTTTMAAPGKYEWIYFISRSVAHIRQLNSFYASKRVAQQNNSAKRFTMLNCVLCVYIYQNATPRTMPHHTHSDAGLEHVFFGWWFRHRADDIVVALPSLWLRCVFTVHASFRDNFCCVYLIFGLFKRLIGSYFSCFIQHFNGILSFFFIPLENITFRLGIIDYTANAFVFV